jgi:hypothetical protein
MMHKIYGNAHKVCIWLDEIDHPDGEALEEKRRSTDIENSDSSGEDSDEEETDRKRARAVEAATEHQRKMAEQDKKAIAFIRDDVLKLWNFDELCKNKAKAGEWAALLSLMRKPWFSRRWVVQEIALAKEAEIYTEKSRLEWRGFVDAVSLFVEVEDATRRLTEIMQRHEVYSHVPDFFEDLSAIGASLLVNATSNLYRKDSAGKKRDSQRTLEYLVSAVPVFDVTEPRDAVFSLLAIAKDATPMAANQQWEMRLFQRIMEKQINKNLQRKTYRVDYGMKVVDVFQQFVEFSIRQSQDRSRALDIICRPWAPDPNSGRSIGSQQQQLPTDEEKLPSWILGPEHTAFKMYHHPNVGRRMGRINADPLVGLPGEHSYRAAEGKFVNEKLLKFKKRSKFYSLFVEGFPLDKIESVSTYSQNGQIPWEWIKASGWKRAPSSVPPEEFWRTLVADRNQHGRNAPQFFERACHESVNKEREGETIDTKKLITEGRCSIVASFLRRVHQVIWNRSLARSQIMKRLCMVPKAAKSGDIIAILYGCSVPVVLRRKFMMDDEIEDQMICDQKEANLPREKAARVILDGFRRRQRQRRENPLPSSPRSAAEIEKEQTEKRKRMDVINKETLQLIEEEEIERRDLMEIILAAQAKPKDDPSREYFEFIGACYVHGMMNGEAIEQQNIRGDKIIPSQVFELR